MDWVVQVVSQMDMSHVAVVVLFWAGIFAVLMAVEGTKRQYRTQMRALQTSGGVAAATLARQDRQETLGRILERVAQGLEAQAGVVLLADGASGALQLVHSIALERFDRLARVLVSDPLVERLLANPDTIAIQPQPEGIWRDLLPGMAGGSLAALQVGTRAQPGVLVLAWRRRGAADDYAEILQVAHQHAHLAMAEFEAREQRLREFHALSQRLADYRAVVEAGLHNLGNAMTDLRCHLEQLECGQLALDEPMLRSMAHKARAVSAALQLLRAQERLEPDRSPLPVSELLELLPEMASLKIGNNLAFVAEVEPGLPPVLGDRLMLMSVLDNLLSNAAKYNRKDGSGWVRLRVMRDGDGVRFVIGDNGRGIPAADLEKLFQLRRRASNTAGVRGSGYGLWSTKSCVEAHGGQIGVESVEGQGSTFWFVIPGAGAARSRPAAPAEAGAPTHPGLAEAPA